MPPTPREALRQRQTALLAALMGKAPVPADFAADRVDLAGRGLERKRAQECRQWLRRAADLLDFDARFAAYAAEAPRAATPRLEAYRFCGWVPACRTAVGVRLGLVEGADDALPARWPRLHLSRLGLALYWPGRGVRWL